MKEGFIKDSLELVLKELQTFLTIAYLFMVGIGMLFNYQKYAHYDINIFQYADILDFLIAPFEDYRIMAFAAFTLLSTYFVTKMDALTQKKFPKFYTKANFGWDKKSWFNTYRLLTFSSVFFVYLFLFSIIYAEHTTSIINQQKPVQIKFTDNSIEEYILIGKTSEVLFLKKESSISVIPIDSDVKEIILRQ